jgi:hypothetical protein
MATSSSYGEPDAPGPRVLYLALGTRPHSAGTICLALRGYNDFRAVDLDVPTSGPHVHEAHLRISPAVALSWAERLIRIAAEAEAAKDEWERRNVP